MKLKIVSFEDNPKHKKLIQDTFDEHDVEFMFFEDPKKDWKVTAKRAKEILAFKPSFVIVDLWQDGTRNQVPGLRTIRQLKEKQETKKLPVVACSVLFKQDEKGRKYTKQAEEMGADLILEKSEAGFPKAENFLSVLK